MKTAEKRPHHKVTFLVLAVAATGFILLQSLVVPALPDFQRAFGIGEGSASWILTAYLLSASVSTPIIGRLGDIHGKERLLLIVLVLLALGTTLSAVADSFGLLLAGRVVQGVGGGIFPLAFGIIRDEFPAERVAGGIGFMSSLIGVGTGAGIVLAGPIVEHLDYHWLFWLPLTTIVVGIAATFFFIPESPVKTPGRINWAAAAAMSAGLVLILVAVSQAAAWGWGSARTLATFAAGIALIVAWVRIELRSPEPLIDMQTMRVNAVWTTNTAAFLFGVGMYSAFILVPQFVQEPSSTGYGFGASVVESGLFLLPSTAFMLLCGQMSGQIDRRIGSRAALLVAAAFAIASFTLLTFSRDQEWEIYVALSGIGIGIGLAFAALPNLIVQNVPQEQTGAATGMNTVMRTLGGALGGQVAASLVAASVSGGYPTNTGFTLAFGFCLLCSVGTLAVALLIPRQPTLSAVSKAT